MTSLSFHNHDISSEVVCEWYKIRDMFFGENCVVRNIPMALEMATSCKHPDAQWLMAACAGKDVKTEEDARKAFLALGQNDARALCFAWLCDEHSEYEEPTLLLRSAELGCALGRACLAEQVNNGYTRLEMALLAAAQRERNGYYQLARCFSFGDGCKKDVEKARENYLLAANLGHVLAMTWLGESFDDHDRRRWRWLGKAAAYEHTWYFCRGFAKQVSSRSVSAVVMFEIGRALHGHVNLEAGTIFNSQSDFDSLVGPAKKAIFFYESQLSAYRRAVDEWTKIGIRWNIVKDVRKLIAKLIWDAREDALYKIKI